jgi:hypothetical protein
MEMVGLGLEHHGLGAQAALKAAVAASRVAA